MIYLASSWRNMLYPTVLEALRLDGHEVYDFRDSQPDGGAFYWSQIQRGYTHGDEIEWIRFTTMLQHPLAQAGFNRNFQALLKADTVVLVLPCNRSSHLELGFGVGSHKRTAILFSTTLEPETMYSMVNFYTGVLDELRWWLLR